MAAVIVCDGLVKSFGATKALDGLDLQVDEGEIHGFLGPNGAGKTVTMRILLGLLRPNAGRATVFGADPWADAVALHRRLAYVPGDTNLWPSLTGGEIIDLLGDLRGGIDPARRATLIERFDLDPRKKARAYSKGNRQKVALVAALASDAPLLILDEPTAGLDPLMEAVFQDALLDVAAEGRTVLLSSHILAEVEKVCDRVTIIRKGQAVETGSLADLRVLSRVTMVAELATDGASLATVPGVHDLRRDDGRVSFEVDHAALADVVRHLGNLGVRSLESKPPTLEELFLLHYGDELEQGQVDHPAIAPKRAGRGAAGR
jgi:ABC-2 type transport system ATP-binding protein